MSSAEGRERDLLEHLAGVFLEDVGLRSGPTPTPAVLDDEEFARIALDLGLVDAERLQAARAALAKTPGLRLWEQLEHDGVLDVGDVLSVFRFHAELCSYASRTVGRYLVVERLGQGASGRVYRAIHQDLLKHVALKILTLGEDAPRSVLERFRREAATAASLRHPSIVGVHDVGVDGDLHYIAMDLVEGATLSEWLRSAPTREERLRVLEEVARAVGFAHDEGVLHRDLKPQNVLVQPEGAPVVVDFGLARAQSDATLTRDGAVLGTPQYMAPEQVRGEVQSLSPAADVYALGVVLYEGLVGETPFAQSDAGLPVVGPGPVRLAARARELLGPGLSAVCAKCLEPDPRDRYPDANELAEELARVRAGLPVKARPLTAWGSLARRLRRRAWTVVAALAAVLAVAGLGWLGWQLHLRNLRLEYAGDVKTAYTVLRSRLEPLLDEAEGLRYSSAVDGRRSALVERVRAVSARTGDTTGVGEAYVEWVRWLVREPDASARLVAVREENQGNPFPALVCAWTHLRAYADAARWPADEEVLLHPIPRAGVEPVFEETDEMKGLLGSASRDLERARACEIWSELSELRWVEDLALGFEHYARGDFEAAIVHLERVGAYNDLPFEPSIVLSFAYSRRGDLEGAFAAIEPLVRRRPEHVTAKRTLAAFYKRRAIEALRDHGGGFDDLRSARDLLAEVSTKPEEDLALANLDLALGLARGRLGEQGGADFARALPVFEQALGGSPEDFSVLGGLTQCLVNLGGEEQLVRAAELSERMIELRPLHAGALELRIGVDLMTLKARAQTIVEADLDDLERRIVQAQERVGSQPTLQFYRLSLFLLRADHAARNGQDIGPWLERSASAARELYSAAPEFHRARFMAWWAESYFQDERRPTAGSLYSEALELRAPFVQRDQRSPFDAQIARRMEQLASELDDSAQELRFRAFVYELSRDLAQTEQDGVEWRTRCARLAEQLAQIEPQAAGSWGRAAFEASRALAQMEAPASTWTAALRSGVQAFVHGEDELYADVQSVGDEALARGEPVAPVHLLRAWLASAAGDQETTVEALDDLRAVLARAKGFEARLGEVNDFGWRVARQPGLPSTSYERALAGLELVAELAGETGAVLNTTGVLLYRLGQWERARVALRGSNELNSRGRGASHPADAAFLALCAHELGEPERARSWRAAMQQGISAWELAEDPETLGFRAEVEAALGGE